MSLIHLYIVATYGMKQKKKSFHFNIVGLVF